MTILAAHVHIAQEVAGDTQIKLATQLSCDWFIKWLSPQPILVDVLYISLKRPYGPHPPVDSISGYAEGL